MTLNEKGGSTRQEMWSSHVCMLYVLGYVADARGARTHILQHEEITDADGHTTIEGVLP